MQPFESLTMEELNNKRGLSVFELLISLSIFSIMIIGFSSIDTFSHYHVISADRRAKLQNEVSYLLEHMAKNMTGTYNPYIIPYVARGGAIGDINQAPVSLSIIGGDNAMIIWIDANSNGKRDASDKQIAYRYSSSNYQIWYYSDYTDSSASYEVIANKIRPNFSSGTSQPTYRTYSSSNNYVEVQIGACWDPDSTPSSCGSRDNPALSMKNRIQLPSSSIH